MLVGRSRWSIAILLLGLVAVAASAEAGKDTAGAETVARSYMTAFYGGDVRTVAKLTHTKTMEDLRKNFLEDMDKAKAEGQLSEFLEETGVEAGAGKLRSMSAYDLYVTLLESSWKMAEKQQGKPTKGLDLKVERSRKVGANDVSVTLKLVIPTPEGPVTKTGTLVLSREGSEWRVKSSEQKGTKKP